jgi:peptidoglycan/LPS O-acetylase OafA/YrhL
MSRPAQDHANPWLDFVRVLAIALVLVRHGSRALQDAGFMSDGVLQNVFLNGWAGVDIFFVLSGYLIAGHLWRSGISSEGFSFARYFGMRALRIFPAYYFVLFITLLGAFPMFPVDTHAVTFRILYHLMFLQDYLPSNINVVFWSLGVEEKFYILAPFLMLFLVRSRKPSSAVLALFMLFMAPVAARTTSFLMLESPIEYAGFWRTFRSPFHFALEGLVIGVALSYVEQLNWIARHKKSGLMVLAISLILLLAFLASHDLMRQITLFDASLQQPLIAILAGGVVCGAVMSKDAAMPIQREIRAIAVLSYSLYLVHYPLIPWVLHHTQNVGVWPFWILYLSSSLLMSALVYALIERPFLKIKDRLRATARSSALSAG